MTIISYIRTGLLSSALLLTTAIATPSMAASSHPLTEISPRQIANDVETLRNAQTGATDVIAQSFDPFEDLSLIHI